MKSGFVIFVFILWVLTVVSCKSSSDEDGMDGGDDGGMTADAEADVNDGGHEAGSDGDADSDTDIDIDIDMDADTDTDTDFCVGKSDFSPCTRITNPDRDYDICINEECVSPGCGAGACNVSGPHFAIPDTGQKNCYEDEVDGGAVQCPGDAGSPDCGMIAFCGQDAQYGSDALPGSGSRFTRNLDISDQPVVSDNVTKLMWQGCNAGNMGSDCSQWDPDSPAGATYDYAVQHCDSLEWGGYDDWHLPDEYELQSIVNYSRKEPPIDPVAFPGTVSQLTWTSSTYDESHGDGLVISFQNGQIDCWDKTWAQYFRCVRSGNSDVGDRYSRTAPDPQNHPLEYVVEDELTGLTWQGCASGLWSIGCAGTPEEYNWQEALSYCQNLSWAGFNDWYLPNVTELFSITTATTYLPSADRDMFPSTPAGAFWSSTTDVENTSYARTVGFSTRTSRTYYKTGHAYVRCARTD